MQNDKVLTVQDDELELATFYVDDALIGIPIEEVVEINHHLDLTPVPHAPQYVLGLMNLRGEVVTVVDLRTVLGLEPIAVGRTTCNVVVRWRGEQVGIVADRVGDVMRWSRAKIDPTPANVAGSDARFFRGVCKLQGQLLILLDTDAVLTVEGKMAA
jgi:purine-binding chemotaxis protein CheW